jgi:hypothetical protein
MKGLPQRPKLRYVEARPAERDGAQFALLTDPRRFSDQSILVSPELLTYLALADGERTTAEIAAAGALRGAPPVTETELAAVFGQLDSVYLVENSAYATEAARRLEDYRNAPHRPLALAGHVYPHERTGLEAQLVRFSSDSRETAPPVAGLSLSAVLSPHIDFARGGQTYAAVWGRAKALLRDVELVVIFGTDHHGDGPRLTLTRQSYATPFGRLNTDAALVARMAEALSEDPELPGHPFADESNHIAEHSVELAAVWLHHALGGRPAAVVPILCGSLHRYASAGSKRVKDAPDRLGHLAGAMTMLREAAAARRTVFVAAADLAHVGPAFGDSAPAAQAVRSSAAGTDAAVLDAFVRADRAGVLSQVQSNSDATRICGLAPMYFTAWAAGSAGATGEWFAYRQCPADDAGHSFVSIAGGLVFGAADGPRT